MELFRWLGQAGLGHPLGMAPDDDEWLEPDDDMGIWEYQLHPLTVAELRRALDGLPGDALVEVDFYDGTDASRTLRPMHIDLKGNAGVTTAMVITVH